MKQKRLNKKFRYTLLFSGVASLLLIIHGVLFDLDLEELGRLTLEGFIITFIMVFVGLLILEKIFTLEGDEEILKIKKRLTKLEKK